MTDSFEPLKLEKASTMAQVLVENLKQTRPAKKSVASVSKNEQLARMPRPSLPKAKGQYH